MIYAVFVAAFLLLAGVLALYLRRDPARRDPDPDAGLIVSGVYDVTQELLPVVRIEGAPFEDAPRPKNATGQGTPARPAAPLAAATATPPAVPGGAEAHPLAGGSSPPAGERQGPGPDSLPEGDAPPQPPQEAPGPGALPPDLANWHLAMWHAAAAQAKIREALTGKDGAS